MLFPIGRDADGLLDILESILNHRAFAALAHQQPDGRIIPLRAQDAVHDGQIEVQLAGILRLEGPNFQIDDEIKMKPHMIREQMSL